MTFDQWWNSMRDKHPEDTGRATFAEEIAFAAFTAGQAEFKKDAELYQELLFAVERKWPDQTRHQTALMYIRRAEQGVLTGVANVCKAIEAEGRKE